MGTRADQNDPDLRCLTGDDEEVRRLAADIGRVLMLQMEQAQREGDLLVYAFADSSQRFLADLISDLSRDPRPAPEVLRLLRRTYAALPR